MVSITYMAPLGKPLPVPPAHVDTIFVPMTLLHELDSSTNPSPANQDSTQDAGENEDIPHGS